MVFFAGVMVGDIVASIVAIVAVVIIVAVLSGGNGADDGSGGRLVGLDDLVLGFFLFMPAETIHDGE